MQRRVSVHAVSRQIKRDRPPKGRSLCRVFTMLLNEESGSLLQDKISVYVFR